MARFELLFYLLIPTLIFVHLFVAPYTKVEESFNIQATHDILVHGVPSENADQFFTSNYDHISFPGSVPRTFVGALVLSGLARPFVGFLTSQDQVQLLVRGILGGLNGLALIAFSRSVQRTFGTSAGIWYALFQASQFHVIYYASRTLPNMFAFFLSTLALRSLLNTSATPWSSTVVPKGYRLTLYLLTFAGVVFRSELAILVGTLTLYLFVTKRISIPQIILPAGLAGAAIGLLCTVSIDSFFWQSVPLWPEWIAFYYNTILGHSSDWGVSPWHHYFSNALPRLLLNPATYLLCIPVAVLNAATRQRALDLLIPIFSFVALYSFLPHKEWRFIIYVIPGLTAVAAAGASWIWTRRAKSAIYALLSLALVSSILLSFAASTTLLAISSLNYPGGEALHYLHTHYHPTTNTARINVYLDNLACQTGATRFLENHRGAETILDPLTMHDTLAKRVWTYDKTEDPSTLLDPSFWHKFDFVLAERPETVIGKWEIGYVVYGFSGVKVLRPGEGSGGVSVPDDGAVRDVHGGKAWADRVAVLWKELERVLRERVFRGWWVEVRMEPKINVLVK
ncbi:glycosyltransferase family 22 protein [Periconia macrospinosa]|uniref:Mannosyltransferase n=1 Tax=Periconia macrospinosa TaxID=97972 RepID=A0A2V1EBP2_9PLEO|nr:glycosyltransferase family 22 protein [Periconia macrospinosa]